MALWCVGVALDCAGVCEGVDGGEPAGRYVFIRGSPVQAGGHYCQKHGQQTGEETYRGEEPLPHTCCTSLTRCHGPYLQQLKHTWSVLQNRHADQVMHIWYGMHYNDYIITGSNMGG